MVAPTDPIDLTHPPTDTGLRELLAILPDIKSAVARIDAIERQTRQWVTEEVAAHLAKAPNAPAKMNL